MKLVADLHIHSHFSRATSKDLTFEHLTRWAQRKGVHVVGTGDIAHPGWLQEMRDALIPAEEGLFRLKDERASAVQQAVPPACQGQVRFMLAGEISTIYKNKGATRKVHHVVFAPDLAAVERLQARLERIGNIRSDGRPILGLPSRDLLEILLEVDERCHLIPAHIWTPWFALLGSKSGYDSVEECFDDLTPHIFALETGLSSDPPMNWRVSSLDRYTLVSNSDAHSPQKLAREATLFDTELSYPALFDALRTGDPATFKGTLEFFPEEGKYHLDGHRACGVCWEPAITLAHNGLCSGCGKEVTVGVMHRVELLADRPIGGRPARTHPFYHIVPLPEILGELHKVGAGSKQVEQEVEKLLSKLGPELVILLETPLEDIAAVGGARLAEGIDHMRRGQVTAQGGYDGEYGVIRVFDALALVAPSEQMSLFEVAERDITTNAATTNSGGEEGDVTANPGRSQLSDSSFRVLSDVSSGSVADPTHNLSLFLPPSTLHSPPSPILGTGELGSTLHLLDGLNTQQCEAVLCVDAPLIVVAGPGTGKTRTLTVRIAYLVQVLDVPPEAILAITFTNKAAGEMAGRLAVLVGNQTADRVTVKTFHAFGASVLRQHGERIGLNARFAILTDDDRQALLKQARPEIKQQELDRILAQISAAKGRLVDPDSPELAADLGFTTIYASYETALQASQAVDFDDLIRQAVRLFEACPDVLQAVQERFRWISVDEYQDVNLAQVRLLRLLSGAGANICAIGDPDQAIYGFRGADRRYFLEFQQDYPGAKLVSLNENYRSTQLILDAAMQVIGRESGEWRVQSEGWSEDQGRSVRLKAIQAVAEFAGQVKLDVVQALTDKAEAELVVHQIEQMVGGTSYFSLDSGRVEGVEQIAARSFADFAVLYRLGAQSRLLIEAFERSGIPYQTVGQTPLYAHKPVREILAFLWLLHTPQSRVHLEKLLEATGVTLPEQVVQDLGELVGAQGNLPDEALEQILQTAEPGIRRSSAADKRQKRLVALSTFWSKLDQFRRDGLPVARVVEQVHGFLSTQRGETPDANEARLVHQLVLRAVPFGNDLAPFLESTALQSETDAYDPRADRVTLMTLHAAKGLEFPVVFIVGCEEGLLPHVRPAEALDVDEERRLFYVGLTRAQRKIVLIHAKTRFLYGQRMSNVPSRFVGDIEAALKEVQQMQRRAETPEPPSVQLGLF